VTELDYKPRKSSFAGVDLDNFLQTFRSNRTTVARGSVVRTTVSNEFAGGDLATQLEQTKQDLARVTRKLEVSESNLEELSGKIPR
jgi:hypothetical protein